MRQMALFLGAPSRAADSTAATIPPQLPSGWLAQREIAPWPRRMARERWNFENDVRGRLRHPGDGGLLGEQRCLN
jgi:hypothetical protein